MLSKIAAELGKSFFLSQLDKQNITDIQYRLVHPIHLHGHDFWIIGQETGIFDLSTSNLNLVNPTRQDVASLPANGYLAIAFKKDNPGSWLPHCHIAWHASQGLAMLFVASQNDIAISLTDTDVFEDTCAA
jgi:hypothetical protein